MPDSESFDAFYARTVWNVTSQMHALADGDSAADHAIREAYARAYQQWYEVSGYRDSEAWVLSVAKAAYERRRQEAAASMPEATAAPGHDPLTSPGMFRPRAGQAQPTADPEATMTGHRPGAPVGSVPGSFMPGGFTPDGSVPADPPGGPAPGALFGSSAPPSSAAAERPPGGLFGSPVPGGSAPAGPMTTAPIADHSAGACMPGQPGAVRQRRLPGLSGLAGLASRRTLIAAVASLVVVIAAGVGYVTLGGRSSGRSPSLTRSAKAVAKPTVRMLPAGRTGTRAAIPWSLVGSGWTLAEVSTAQPGPDGDATSSGSYTTFLVDPEGGKYLIQTTSGTSAPELLAWSGNAETALYRTDGTAPSYGLLTLASGGMTSLSLPAGVIPVGFTRPHGINILAVRQGQAKYRLERYNLTGAYQATLGSLPRPAGAPDGLLGNALSSPDGTVAVWGVSGDEMQLVSNAGGLIRKLHVPDSGKPPACLPLSWWDSGTVLAYCNVAGQDDAGRLWLVPDNGSSPTALTGVSGSLAGVGDLEGAWQAGNQVYITASSGSQCSGAASGPGGLSILRLSQSEAESPVSIPDTTNNYNTVVAGVGGRLLVLAQTSCPGTSSLIWFNPATDTSQTVLTAPATEVGVIAAVPFGLGPTAVAGP